jgi:hypothetical protein
MPWTSKPSVKWNQFLNILPHQRRALTARERKINKLILAYNKFSICRIDVSTIDFCSAGLVLPQNVVKQRNPGKIVSLRSVSSHRETHTRWKDSQSIPEALTHWVVPRKKERAERSKVEQKHTIAAAVERDSSWAEHWWSNTR